VALDKHGRRTEVREVASEVPYGWMLRGRVSEVILEKLGRERANFDVYVHPDRLLEPQGRSERRKLLASADGLAIPFPLRDSLLDRRVRKGRDGVTLLLRKRRQ
jgi:hypothetical protein